MLITIPAVLPHADALALGQRLAAADWVNGNVTSGAGAALAKRNRQLPEGSEASMSAQRIVQRALAGNALFLSAALPARIVPPLFNRYSVGEGFGTHIDNAIRIDAATGAQLRTDLSATLFLSDPADYDGGALTVEGDFGAVEYKCAAGDLLLYPASSLHRVTEVTRGERIASFFWIQSLVRDDAARQMLFDLDQSVQVLTADRGADDAEVLRLTKVYHNLVRRWGG
jgi:PKHD-type hydroxylase